MRKILQLYQFNMKYTFKKRSTLVNILMALIIPLTTFVILLVTTNPGVRNKNNMLYWIINSGGFPILLLIFCVFLSIYLVFIVVNLFKDAAHDNTEMLILTKAFSRKKIVISKFVCLFNHIVLISSVFLLEFFICSFLNNTSFQESIVFTLSMYLGFIFYGILFASFSLFVCLVFGKLPVIILAVLSTFLLIISSMFIRGETGANVVKSNTYYANYQLYKNANMAVPPANYLSFDSKLITSFPMQGLNSSHHTNQKYEKAIKYDFWTQINNLFFMIDSQTRDHHYHYGKNQVKYIYHDVFELNTIAQNLDQPIQLAAIKNIIIDSRVNSEQKTNEWYFYKKILNQDTLINQLLANSFKIINQKIQFTKQQHLTIGDLEINNERFNRKIISAFIENVLAKEDEAIFNVTDQDGNNVSQSELRQEFENTITNIVNKLFVIYYLKNTEKNILYWTSNIDPEFTTWEPFYQHYKKTFANLIDGKFINSELVLSIWLLITLLLFSVSILIYLKRDFK